MVACAAGYRREAALARLTTPKGAKRKTIFGPPRHQVRPIRLIYQLALNLIAPAVKRLQAFLFYSTENIPHYFIIRQNMPVHHSREVTVLKRKLKTLATQHKLLFNPGLCR